jgi:hypothetical protein
MAKAGKGNGKGQAERVDKTPRQRFLELGPKRTTHVLQALDVLGNCAAKNSYEYSEDEAEKIFTAIVEKLSAVRMKFREAHAGRQKESFSL